MCCCVNVLMCCCVNVLMCESISSPKSGIKHWKQTLNAKKDMQSCRSVYNEVRIHSKHITMYIVPKMLRDREYDREM